MKQKRFRFENATTYLLLRKIFNMRGKRVETPIKYSPTENIARGGKNEASLRTNIVCESNFYCILSMPKKGI